MHFLQLRRYKLTTLIIIPLVLVLGLALVAWATNDFPAGNAAATNGERCPVSPSAFDGPTDVVAVSNVFRASTASPYRSVRLMDSGAVQDCDGNAGIPNLALPTYPFIDGDFGLGATPSTWTTSPAVVYGLTEHLGVFCASAGGATCTTSPSRYTSTVRGNFYSKFGGMGGVKISTWATGTTGSGFIQYGFCLTVTKDTASPGIVPAGRAYCFD